MKIFIKKLFSEGQFADIQRQITLDDDTSVLGHTVALNAWGRVE